LQKTLEENKLYKPIDLMCCSNKSNRIYKSLLFIFFLLIDFKGFSQQEKDTTKLMNVRYGSKGIELETRGKKFLFQLASRLQFRFSTPNDTDPLTYDDYSQDPKTTFKINRARLKVGGSCF
jgi:phosphate-selective porin OprO/OprP